MTNEELNEICCVEAGLKPTRRELCSCYGPKHEPECENPIETIYPPVSTEWAAAGRLMDVLFPKVDVMFWKEMNGKVRVRLTCSKNGEDLGHGIADTSSMALCLAVAALAGKKGAQG